MLFHNFITLLRRYTTSSLLNIVGMAVAFASIYLIAVQVQFDLTFNRVITNSERIYRLEYPSWSEDGTWWSTWNRQMPDAMCAVCPDVETAGSISLLSNAQYYDEYSIKRNSTIDNLTIPTGGAERAALAVFPFEFVAGSLEALTTTHDMILAESVADRYNLAVGDRLYAGRGAVNQLQYTVVGIYKDFPKPSTLSMSRCFVLMREARAEEEGDWNSDYYVLLREGASVAEVEQQMRDYVVDDCQKRGFSEEEMKIQLERVTPRLNPITNLYFAEDTQAESMHGSRTTTYTLIAIAALILVISFINFINFFFALIPSRIRAINNYKIFGAPTWNLRLNFLFETVGLILVSLFGAAVIVVLFADTPLADYISTPVAIDEHWTLTGVLVTGLLLFGMAVSCYPAWYITKFPPAFVTKGDFSASRSGQLLRYTLVGVQYTISIALIICSLLIYRQHHYMLTRDMGFDKENLLALSIPYEAVNGPWNGYELDYTKRDALLDRLRQNPQIKSITLGRGTFVGGSQMQWSRTIEDGSTQTFNVYVVSWDFLRMMGIEVIEGRDFLPSDEQNETGALIFNEKAVEAFGVGLDSQIQGHVNDANTPIVGICRDFNFQSAHFGIQPYAFLIFGKYGWDMPNHAYLRTVAGADIAALRAQIVDTVMENNPNINPEKIEVKFFDDELEFIYQREDKLSTLITLFSLLSILISIIGVFGLVLFETQYRRREIGIRRVYGASVKQILMMLNRKYLCIVLLCAVVAIPVSCFVIGRWTEQYVYRLPMAGWVFAVAVLAIVLVTLLTVTFRSWRAANENPTRSIMR